jgi:exonuclease SbcD
MLFIHAADIHLDSAAAGAPRDDLMPPDITHRCTRRAFEKLIDLAIDEAADFLVIAGDIFDANMRDYSTSLYFAQQMQRLGRPCFIVRGNHDADSVITRNVQASPNMRVFSSRKAETFELPALKVALHGRSFPDRAVTEDLSQGYPAPLPGWLNIGVLHSSADDTGGRHARYAPCNPEALHGKGYDYWALGHIHERRVLARSPWVVFPGNLQGRHPNETGAKGAMLVRAEDGKIVGEPEFRALDVLRWAAVQVALDGAADMDALRQRARDALAGAADAAEGRPVIARLFLTGASELHADLLADPARTKAECQGAAFDLGREVYVDAVRMQTRPAATAAENEALSQLRSAFEAAGADQDLTEGLLRDLQALAEQVPANADGAVELPRDADAIRALLGDAWELVAHALREGRPL